MINVEPEKWMEKVKVGDKVAIRNDNVINPNFALDEVAHITKSGQITLRKLSVVTFSKRGSEIGKKDNLNLRRKLYPLTDEILENIRKREILRYMNQVNFTALPVSDLEEIHAILTHRLFKKQRKEVQQ